MIIQYFTRWFNRRSPLKASPYRSIKRSCRMFTSVYVLSLIIVFFVWLVRLNRCCLSSSSTIVSLTTTPARFQYELPFAIHSLLSQSELPEEIHIYIPSINDQSNLSMRQLKHGLQRLDKSNQIAARFDQLVRIHYTSQDYGPATKFLPVIEEHHAKGRHLQAIIICDDDQYYHSQTVSTLNMYADKYETSIVGLRGWRGNEILR
jgi:hypothetical protein